MELRETQLASQEQRIILRQLAESVAAPGCKFLEIGSWCGDSTTVIAKVAREFGGHLYCVDWWRGNVGTELVDIASSEDVFTTFWKRITAEGLDDVVIPIRCRADLAPVILKENSFDFIFIDADHRYKQVSQDIRSYMPLVRRPGGIFCGHDCEGTIGDFDLDFLQGHKDVDFYQSVHCGVILAVGETFLDDYSINCSIWSVCASVAPGRWEATNLTFVGVDNQKMTMPTPIGASAGYVIWRYGKALYATPRHMGQVDIRSESVRGHPEVISASTMQELETLTDQGVNHLGAYDISGSRWHKIVIDGARVYVIPASLPDIDYTNMSVYVQQGIGAVFESLYEAQLYISQLSQNILTQRLAMKEVGINALLGATVKGIESIARRYFQRFEGLDSLKRRLYDIKIDMSDKYAAISDLQTTPGRNVSGQASNPVVCEVGYRGFNIVEFEGRYYAILQDVGSIDFHQEGVNQSLLALQGELQCLTGDSLPEVRHLVDQLTVIKAIERLDRETGALHKKAVVRDIQVVGGRALVDRAVKGIEAILHRYFQLSGVRIALFDADAAIDKPKVELVCSVLSGTSGPVMCEVGYLGFNIIEFDGRYYAVLQEVGSIDFHQEGVNQRLLELQRGLKCFIGESLSEVRGMVEQLSAINALQRLDKEMVLLHKGIVVRDIKEAGFNALLDRAVEGIELIVQWCFQLYGVGADLPVRYVHMDQSKGEVAVDVPAPGDKPPGSKPIVYENNYLGFNILGFNGRYYAVLQELGSLDFAREGLEQRLLGLQLELKCFVGGSISEVRHLVERLNVINTLQREAFARGIHQAGVNTLLDTAIKGIESLARRCGIHVDLPGRYEANAEILLVDGASGQGKEPFLCEGGYKGFNIIGFDGRYYAALQNVGSIDFHHEALEHRLLELQQELRCFIGRSVSEAKHLVDQLGVISVIERLHREVDALHGEIAARDALVQSLRMELSNRDVQIEMLRQETSDKAAQIDLLYDDITQWATRLSELQGNIRDRDLWIALLQKELLEWPRRIGIIKNG
ncbi:MAG: class I SAM-dependent methyltransferase [Nitrospirae bacterium]|nr:class I SAM-dependent methyltransferase [Nitrospirota bacterium]